MKKLSVTVAGILALLLGAIGVQIAESDLQTTVSVIIQIIGAVVAYYGRWRHGDLSIFGIKRS